MLRQTFVVAFILGATALHAQNLPTWIQKSNGGPSPRMGHAMVYDSARGNVVLFGGWDASGTMGDTWEWDGTSWTQRNVSGPSARFGHAMTYHSQLKRTVLHGGKAGSSGPVFSGLWYWDGSAWTSIPTPTGPSPGPRDTHALAYDSDRNHIVLFGGSLNNDTWKWDGLSWVQLATSGPSSRGCSLLTYDTVRQRMVLFGGLARTAPGTPSTVLNDTWEWDGTTWTEVLVSGPMHRHSYGMAFDTVREHAVLFGGYSLGGQADTWEWDGVAWTEHLVVGPPPRSWHAMAYDTQRQCAVMFGGWLPASGGGGGPVWGGHVIGDTWELSSLTSGTASAYGSGCGTPELTLSPDPQARPILGSTARVSLVQPPNPMSFVSSGWSDASTGTGLTLPYALGGYGMPGCFLLTSADFGFLPFDPQSLGGADIEFYLTFPNVPWLLGVEFYLQGLALAPGQNAGGAITSNGVVWTLGNS